MSKGIVLLKHDTSIEERAKAKGYEVLVDAAMPLAFEKTLFVTPGKEMDVPWDLLPAAWHFLDRWDAAVPLWRYATNASDVGTKAERKATKAVARDLRVLLHAVELLFVRDGEQGRALMDAYRQELNGAEAPTTNRRLAFLRAMYQVKPRVCVLPRTWLRKIYERSKMDARATSTARNQRPTGQRLVTVELAPGRFVKCNPGDEEKVKRMLTGGRHN